VTSTNKLSTIHVTSYGIKTLRLSMPKTHLGLVPFSGPAPLREGAVSLLHFGLEFRGLGTGLEKAHVLVFPNLKLKFSKPFSNECGQWGKFTARSPNGLPR
jgi:hypothetical protein